jgi:hypothetical protein
VGAFSAVKVAKGNAMERRQKKPWVIAALLILCVVAIGWETTRRIGQTQVRTAEGTIVQIDTATRQAVFEIVHPKTGKPLRIEGSVPQECDIQIDGKAAQLADLRVGEKVRAEGTIYPDLAIVVNWVRVHRPVAATASQPTATRPDTRP